jgi:hypothetical protein
LCSNESAFGLVLVVLVKEVVKPRERVELGFIVGVGVDLQRDGQAEWPRMTRASRAGTPRAFSNDETSPETRTR